MNIKNYKRHKYSITEVVRQCIINKLDFNIEIELKNKDYIILY